MPQSSPESIKSSPYLQATGFQALSRCIELQFSSGLVTALVSSCRNDMGVDRVLPET